MRLDQHTKGNKSTLGRRGQEKSNILGRPCSWVKTESCGNVHILDAVLKQPTAALDLVEKELLLQTARYLQRNGTVVCRIAFGS